MTPTTPRRHRILLAALPLAAAIALIACGGDSGDSEAAVPDYSELIASAPPPLAALYEQGPVIVEGGSAAYEEQLARLEGYPVVVNKWASWCLPCREEFPYLQNQAAEHGDEVAFLGIDSDDSTAAAETFLRDNPVPYPSISDPDRELAISLDALENPTTLFYDQRGELVHQRRGPYANEQELAAEIERYALGS